MSCALHPKIEIFPSSKPITRARGKVYALFSTSELNESSINFREKILKMIKIMSSWSARNLTLLGKIAILKSLVVSQIVYLLSSLPSPPGVIREINCLLYDFLWDSKGDNIKRTEMINEFIYLFINIIYTEIPVQHSWFKWRSVQKKTNK